MRKILVFQPWSSWIESSPPEIQNSCDTIREEVTGKSPKYSNQTNQLSSYYKHSDSTQTARRSNSFHVTYLTFHNFMLSFLRSSSEILLCLFTSYLLTLGPAILKEAVHCYWFVAWFRLFSFLRLSFNSGFIQTIEKCGVCT